VVLCWACCLASSTPTPQQACCWWEREQTAAAEVQAVITGCSKGTWTARSRWQGGGYYCVCLLWLICGTAQQARISTYASHHQAARDWQHGSMMVCPHIQGMQGTPLCCTQQAALQMQLNCIYCGRDLEAASSGDWPHNKDVDRGSTSAVEQPVAPMRVQHDSID
jgi:hypothetical protein